jgi:hypothetical protein
MKLLGTDQKQGLGQSLQSFCEINLLLNQKVAGLLFQEGGLRESRRLDALCPAQDSAPSAAF